MHTTTIPSRSTKILNRVMRNSAIRAALVRRENFDGSGLEDKHAGDENMVAIITRAVDTAVAARQSILSSKRVRVELDEAGSHAARHVVIVDLHDDGALAVVVPLGDPSMKSMNRSLQRAWVAGLPKA
jgi:hypothetical protein